MVLNCHLFCSWESFWTFQWHASCTANRLVDGPSH